MLLEDFDKMVLIEVCCTYDSSLLLHSDFSFEIQTMHSTIYMKSPFGGLLGKSSLRCPEHNSRFLHLYHPQTSALCILAGGIQSVLGLRPKLKNLL